MSEGVDPRRIDVRAGAAPLGDGQSVVMRFSGYEAKVPECGDWTGAAGFNPGNLPHPNFGCAYQRNIGLMLSDPGELLQAREAAPTDASRPTLRVGGFKSAEETEVEVEAISSF